MISYLSILTSSIVGEFKIYPEKSGLNRFCYFIILFFFPLFFSSEEKKGKNNQFSDRAERHDLRSRLWLFVSLFTSLLEKRGKKKRRMNIKNREFKSCFSAPSNFRTKQARFGIHPIVQHVYLSAMSVPVFWISEIQTF